MPLLLPGYWGCAMFAGFSGRLRDTSKQPHQGCCPALYGLQRFHFENVSKSRVGKCDAFIMESSNNLERSFVIWVLESVCWVVCGFVLDTSLWYVSCPLTAWKFLTLLLLVWHTRVGQSCSWEHSIKSLFCVMRLFGCLSVWVVNSLGFACATFWSWFDCCC